MHFNSYDDYKLANPYDEQEDMDICPSCGQDAEYIENDLCECCAVRCSGCEEYVLPENATANVAESNYIMPILCDECLKNALETADAFHNTTIDKSNHIIKL